MENFIKPNCNSFTIYSKSNCCYCEKVKELLNNHKIQFVEVNCDKYLSDSKLIFLTFIKSMANKNFNTFPMVFDKGVFIGGFIETNKHIEKEYIDFNETF